LVAVCQPYSKIKDYYVYLFFPNSTKINVYLNFVKTQ